MQEQQEWIDLLYRLGGVLTALRFQRRKEPVPKGIDITFDYAEDTLRDALHGFGWNNQDIDLAIEIRDQALDNGEEEVWDQDWRKLWVEPQLSWAAERRAEMRAMGVTE